jgi:hypothetical protein
MDFFFIFSLITVSEVMDESSSSRKRTASDSVEVIEDVPRKRLLKEAPVIVGSGDVDCVTLDDDSADGNNAAAVNDGINAAANEDDDCVCID